ncbi:MAG: hypothetical protein KF718_05350 [Polyangiaceae bacterium]|nr:hypothetical protein [Polyangiaceae bacterium]
MEDGLGAVASPAHAGSVEPHADEMAHGALDHTAADRQVLAAELLVAHAGGVLGEVVDDLVEHLAAVVVANVDAGLGGVTEQGACDGAHRTDQRARILTGLALRDEVIAGCNSG